MWRERRIAAGVDGALWRGEIRPLAAPRRASGMHDRPGASRPGSVEEQYGGAISKEHIKEGAYKGISAGRVGPGPGPCETVERADADARGSALDRPQMTG